MINKISIDLIQMANSRIDEENEVHFYKKKLDSNHMKTQGEGP